MIIDLRKSTREMDYLPVTVHAVNGVDGVPLAGPFSSRIIDFSSSGACLLMTQVLKDRYHVFHTTRENNSSLLLLTINIPPHSEEYKIQARPVWLNVFSQHNIRAFKIGVEFLSNPKGKYITEIQKALQKGRSKRGKWWADTCAVLSGE